MNFLHLIIALVIQVSFTHASLNSEEKIYDENDIFYNNTDIDKEVTKDDNNNDDANNDLIDLLLLPDASLYPTSSVTMMTQATDSDKPIEEQLEDIKEIAKKITLAIQSEMANLLSYALLSCENQEVEDSEDKKVRKRRSTDTPMASSQLITRLLKHIKSNNEFQNIAIDKLMTAQEIADKYGIEFSPDTEIISDLAFAANQQAKEMNSLLHDTITTRNFTKDIKSVNQETLIEPPVDFYHYSGSYPSYNNYPHETQIPAPVLDHYKSPVSKHPNFYDAISYSLDNYLPYCSMDPFSSSSNVFPSEEIYETEPELVGEEFEETVSSKVYVDHGDKPGSTIVNHVMTYKVAEKSRFKTPAIEKLPQQMQYSFFLM